MVAGRLFLDKRVPDTMRGQAQALYQLLVFSVAGIIGAFFCGWLYESQSEAGVVQWTYYWLILAAMTLIPLAYFFIGVVGKPSRRNLVAASFSRDD
jgi:MFS family permease